MTVNAPVLEPNNKVCLRIIAVPWPGIMASKNTAVINSGRFGNKFIRVNSNSIGRSYVGCEGLEPPTR